MLPCGCTVWPLRVTVTAFSVAHCRVEDSPRVMLVGTASNRTIDALNTGAALTVTVMLPVACLLFVALVAVRVYVVVVVGQTCAEPSGRLLVVTPGVMVMVSALATFHEMMEHWPTVIVGGFAS